MQTISSGSTPVLLLKSSRHGGLGVVRSLGRLGIPVYVLDADPHAPALCSKYCRGSFLFDFERADTDESIEYLATVGRTLGGPPILIPTSDTGAVFVAAHAGPLRQSFIFPAVSHALVRSLCNKREMYSLATNAGMPTPKTFFPLSTREVADFARNASFPVIVKRIEGECSKLCMASNVIANTKQELIDCYRHFTDLEIDTMMQEYIPGGDTATWIFNGYFNERSECIFALTGRKIRQSPPYAGITTFGICEPNDSLTRSVKAFMKDIGYRGILDIGYRYDARDGSYKVFDVNPRIGCTFRLFVSDSGMDVARALYCDITGQPVVAGASQPGRCWAVEDLDLRSAFQYWRDGKLKPKMYVRSWYGVAESAFFAKDDLRPLFSMGTNALKGLFRQLQTCIRNFLLAGSARMRWYWARLSGNSRQVFRRARP